MSRSTRQRRSVAQPAAPEAQGTYRWRWPLALLGLVLALKMALALTLAGHPLLQPEGELDAGEYWRLAQRVAGGDVLLTGTPFYVSPLYIYWLAFAQAITGASVAGVLVLQAALGTLAVWLTARTAALWVPDDSARPRGGRGRRRARAHRHRRAAGRADPAVGARRSAHVGVRLRVHTRVAAVVAEAWAWCGVALALLATNRPNAWLLAPSSMCACAADFVAHVRRGPGSESRPCREALA